MKVGNKPPVPPVPENAPVAEGPPKIEEGAPFAERLASADGADGAGGVNGAEAPLASDGMAAARPPEGVHGLERIAGQVDRGELSADQAMRQVVDRVLESQLPQGADEALRQRLRSLVELSLRSDPFLSSLVRRLEGTR